MAPGPKVKIEQMSDPFSVITYNGPEATPFDPVIALDPEERKTRYYESPNILGKLYRLVDEKGFYEQLQEETRDFHRGREALEEVLAYACRASAGFEFKQYLGMARDIRSIYEEGLEDVCHTYALHQAHPLHEIEVVTGAVLGSVFVRKLREMTKDMKERFARDVAYIRERIRYDELNSDEEGMPRAVACLYVGVKEKGRKVGKHGDVRMWSWPYIAAAVCLEEIERFNGGKLPAVNEYCEQVQKTLRAEGFHADTDLSGNTVRLSHTAPPILIHILIIISCRCKRKSVLANWRCTTLSSSSVRRNETQTQSTSAIAMIHLPRRWASWCPLKMP